MPNLTLPESSDLKSFWSRPEGKTGMIFLGALGVAGVYFWGEYIAPFLVSMLVDTVHIGELAGLLALGGYMTFGARPRLFYRVMMRALTGILIKLDPIAIIEDKLIQMKKRRDKMNEQIGEVNGQRTLLKRTMATNHQTAVQGFSMASQAQKMAGSAHDEQERLRMELQVKANARKAQRRENANIGYANLLAKLDKIYDFLTRYAAHIDFFIDDTQDEVDQKKIEYKTTRSAFSAVQMALKVLKGNAVEEDIYDQAMEAIESDVSRKLGIMDDLQRVSQNFMDGLDVQEGAVDDQALKALDAYEQKLLNSGDSELKVMTTAAKGNPIPVAASQFTSGKSDLDDLLKF